MTQPIGSSAIGEPLDVTDSEVLELRAADVMRLEPGDVIVVSLTQRLTAAGAASARDRLGVLFPEHQVVILDCGGWIAAVRPVPALSTPAPLMGFVVGSDGVAVAAQLDEAA